MPQSIEERRESHRIYMRQRRCEDPTYSRRLNLQHLYGLSLEQYDEMLTAQGGRCAVCTTTTPGGRGSFHVDHDHDTGAIRALLCHDCNTGLGKFADSPERLRKAAAYLEGRQ